MTEEPDQEQLLHLAGDPDRPLPDPSAGIRHGRLSQLDPPMPRWVLNHLFRDGYRTIAQVDQLTDDKIRQTPGFGTKALQAIRASREADVRRPPTHETPLAELLPDTLLALGDLVRSASHLLAALEAIGVRTAEELAIVDAELLYKALEPCTKQTRAVIHRLRETAHDEIAGKLAANSDEVLAAAQMRELISLLGQLAQYADEDHNTVLERRATALLHLFVPGYPDLDNPDAHSPQRPDDPTSDLRCNAAEPSR